jgi:hypothetical protein
MRHALCRGFLQLLCGALVLCAWPARATMVQPSVAESGSVIVTAEIAEVRDGPSSGSNVITVVEKGEVFLKEGRTGAWYYVRINDDFFGWISGRAVSRYQEEESEGSSSTDIGPDEGRSSSYYPRSYSVYPYFYYWGQPFVSWEWYFSGRGPYRDHSWDHDKRYPGDRDHDRPGKDGRHSDHDRPRDDGRHKPDRQPHSFDRQFHGPFQGK